MAGILMIGYGNTLRGDDGLGWYAAHWLARRIEHQRGPGRRFAAACPAEAKVLAVRQLTPELAEEISRSEQVIFMDACCSRPPGQWSCKLIEPGLEVNGSITHHLTPSSLVALSRELYGTCPGRACFLTIGGEFFGYREGLSAAAARGLSEVVDSWGAGGFPGTSRPADLAGVLKPERPGLL
jgi:hydrogenase maturation protease